MLSCPAINKSIDLGYCQELQMAVNNEIIWDGLEDNFNEKQKAICKNCRKRISPAE